MGTGGVASWPKFPKTSGDGKIPGDVNNRGQKAAEKRLPSPGKQYSSG
jgi:hypothetical protein